MCVESARAKTEDERNKTKSKKNFPSRSFLRDDDEKRKSEIIRKMVFKFN
jgi:hypothetical protein